MEHHSCDRSHREQRWVLAPSLLRVHGVIASIPLTRLGLNNIAFAFSKKKTNIFHYHPGGVDGWVEIADAEKLMYWELPSVMSSTALTLMLTNMQRVTWRAAEEEDTLLLICPPTYALSYSLQIHVNSRKRLSNLFFPSLLDIGEYTLLYSIKLQHNELDSIQWYLFWKTTAKGNHILHFVFHSQDNGDAMLWPLSVTLLWLWKHFHWNAFSSSYVVFLVWLLSICHCDLVPQFFQLILLKSHTCADSFYIVSWRTANDSERWKHLMLFPTIIQWFYHSDFCWRIMIICTLGRRTRERGMAVFNRHWEQGAAVVRCVCGCVLSRVLYALCSALLHKKRIFDTPLITVALPLQQPIREILEISWLQLQSLV